MPKSRNWTQAEYEQFLQRARRDKARDLSSSAIPEPPVCHGALAAPQGEKGDSPRFAVLVISCRRKLLDPDNLVGGAKYFIDGLRYAGIIPEDRPEDIDLAVRQQKVKTKIEERTEIVVKQIV